MPRQLSASDLSRVRLSLQQSGISQQGIQQILSSQPIMNPLDRQAMLSTRSTPVCSKCRSDDIISHATAQWSNEKQEWELANTFAQPAHCNSCNAPCEIVWLPLN